jgi:hypothetical protein
VQGHYHGEEPAAVVVHDVVGVDGGAQQGLLDGSEALASDFQELERLAHGAHPFDVHHAPVGPNRTHQEVQHCLGDDLVLDVVVSQIPCFAHPRNRVLGGALEFQVEKDVVKCQYNILEGRSGSAIGLPNACNCHSCHCFYEIIIPLLRNLGYTG